VLTTCAIAIAETGTILLDAGPGQGPRALTLVPDHHLVVVRADQVGAIVADAVAGLEPSRPLTWISGPSATCHAVPRLCCSAGMHNRTGLWGVVTDLWMGFGHGAGGVCACR
jgi:LUD domain